MPIQSTTRRSFLRSVSALAALGFSERRGFAADSAATGNDVIDKARQAALAVLKPNSREVEHGLRLHAESIVFDVYGFAPRSAVESGPFLAAAEAGASDAELRELREEQMMTTFATDEVEQAEFFAAFHASGVTCIFKMPEKKATTLCDC